MERDTLHLSITDAMGHDVRASMLATLAVGALRNARRAGVGLADQARNADASLGHYVNTDGFVTGQIARIDLRTGTATIVNAGHPWPLRLRDGRVESIELDADPPFGLYRGHGYRFQLPGVRAMVRHGLPLALANPVTAIGVYMAVVGNGHLPDPELARRLRQNAFRWAPAAECANEAITASGLSPRAFYRRRLEYPGPVLAPALGRGRSTRPACAQRRCHDRVSASAAQRLEEDGPPSPARAPDRARAIR